MATPRSLARAQLLTILKANNALVAVVPATRIYRQATPKDPVWPFIKLGPPTTTRLRASGVNGGEVTIDIHAFARHRYSNSQVAEYAEDYADRIGGLIEAALSDRRFALPGGQILHIELSDNQLLQDDEPEAFHWVAQANIRVLA